MEDLAYIVSLGFSGADLWRAAIIAFFLAMYTVKGRSVWMMAGIGLVIDRLAWPLIGQSVAGASPESIGASFIGMAKTFPEDLGLYLVRYIGLAGMVAFFIFCRKRIHAGFARG